MNQHSSNDGNTHPETLPSIYAAPLILAQTEPHLILSQDSLIVLEANEAFTQALGITRKELIGRSVLQWIFSEERTTFTGTIRMASRHALPPQVFFQWKVAGNQLLPMEVMAWPLALSAHTKVLALSARPRARVSIDASGRMPLNALTQTARRFKTVG